MGITNMVMPKIEREAEARNYGKFVISPLERGYGVTLGNALRRVLLSSLEGAAVTSIRIADVLHEISEIPGVREATRLAARRATSIVVVSHYLRRELEAKLPELRPKLEVVDCGVDLERFHGRDAGEARRLVGWEGDGPFFLCVGTLDERKNQLRLAEAFARLGHGELALVGSGVRRSKLLLPGALLGRLPGVEVVDDLAVPVT